MPERFVLECLTSDGSRIDWGLYESSAFGREPDGTYVCAGSGGSPLLFAACAKTAWLFTWWTEAGVRPPTAWFHFRAAGIKRLPGHEWNHGASLVRA